VTSTVGERVPAVAHCVRCGTELAPAMLACPACGTLVHAERLKELAASAAASTTSGQLVEASRAWQEAMDLLPPGSQQHAVISERVADITRQLAAGPSMESARTSSEPWHKRGIAAAVAIGVLLLSKLKFLILGLAKAKTFISMFAFFGVYWTVYGWPLALGLVLSIYIHEMGHVSVLRQLGIGADAPLFIPGVGAVVMMKQHITDPSIDARIGLAGPLWGLGAGLAAYVTYLVTGTPIWGAIAQLTGFLNLFNLIPVWQLDGARGFHALAWWQRWVVVATMAAAYYATRQPLLLIVGAVATWRSLQRNQVKPDMRALGTFVLLVVALAWLSVSHTIR
jgi:Zn-dependent protease